MRAVCCELHQKIASLWANNTICDWKVGIAPWLHCDPKRLIGCLGLTLVNACFCICSASQKEFPFFFFFVLADSGTTPSERAFFFISTMLEPVGACALGTATDPLAGSLYKLFLFLPATASHFGFFCCFSSTGAKKPGG